MRKLADFCTTHFLALLFAVSVGIILSMPTVLATRSLGDDYKGVPFLYQDNEVYYAARIREVADGDYFVNSPMLHEFKNIPSTFTPFGEYLYSIISLLPFVDIVKAMLISKFLLPTIFFLLIYYFSWNLLKNSANSPKLFSVAISSFALLGFDLFNSAGINYFLNAGSNETYLSIWTRLVNPITGGIYLFVFLILFKMSIENRKTISFFVSGIVLGLMTGYYFSFALGIFISLFWFIYFLFGKNSDAVKKIFLMYVVGALVNLHTFEYLFIKGSKDGEVTSPFRSGLLATNEYLVNKVLLIIIFLYLLLYLVFRWKKIDQSKFSNSNKWIISLIFASFIAMNTQVLIGYAIWPQHFVQYVTIFSIIVFFSLLALLEGRVLGRITKIVAIFSIILNVFFALKTVPSYAHSVSNFREVQGYAPVLNYIRDNSDGDCVTLVSEPKDKLAPFVSIMTPCDTYITSYVSVSVPLGRVKHNYFVLLKLKGITENDIDKYVREHPSDIYHEYFFRDWKDMFYASNNPWLVAISDRDEIEKWIDSTSEKVINDYKEFLKKDFVSEVGKNKVDYILYDIDSGHPDPKNILPNLELVFFDSHIKVYEFE